jgi:hypothetical protein
MILTKGQQYTAQYTTTDFTLLASNAVGYNLTTDLWTGNVVIYSTYPGTALVTITATPTLNGSSIIRNGAALDLTITALELQGFTDGSYMIVSTISNSNIGVSITRIDNATITTGVLSNTTTCKIYGNLRDITTATIGSWKNKIITSGTTSTLTPVWEGTEIRASISTAVGGNGYVYGTTTVKTTTDATGYFEFNVLQGLSVIVKSDAFAAQTVLTTGKTSVNLSTYF